MNKTALRRGLAVSLVAAIGLVLLLRERLDAATLQDWVRAAGAT